MCCHPVKNAAKDNLIPDGRQRAFLNEVDGNLTLWANTERQTSSRCIGAAKFRGLQFNPLMAFELVEEKSERVKGCRGAADAVRGRQNYMSDEAL